MRSVLPLAVLALAGCTARGNAPRSPWVELARADAFLVSYDPGQLRTLDDGTIEARVRLHYPAPLEFQSVRYDTNQQRVRVRCGELAMVAAVSDSLILDGRVMAGHYYGGTLWGTVQPEDEPDKRWPLHLCDAARRERGTSG